MTAPAMQNSAMPPKATPRNRKQDVAPTHLVLVEAICAYIDEQEGERVTLKDLAERFETSPWHLQRIFRRALGISPRDYAEAKRSDRFRRELRRSPSVTDALYGAGYGSSSRAYENAQGLLGMTPASYAKGGKGARIAYAFADSPLGLLLVAATAKGVCFVCIGEDREKMVGELQQEFPEAEEIFRDDASIAPALETLVPYLQGKTPHLELNLDIRATAFQYRVWQELLAIPAGETRTYQEIAERLGLEQGQRAVGNACANNPVALIIPCHRAHREDDQISGYRWGVERKRALLYAEAERCEILPKASAE